MNDYRQRWSLPIVGTIGTLSLASTAVPAVAATLHVPGVYERIQLAIDAASDGDEVLVARGCYRERIDFLGKAIVVRSADGAPITMIDGSGGGSTVTCTNDEQETSVLRGFTVTGGVATFGGGILAQGSSPTVEDCIFTLNDAINGGGMACIGGDPTVRRCTFLGNTGGNAGGIWVQDAAPSIEDCRFGDNFAWDDGGAIAYVDGSSGVLADSVFVQNRVVDEPFRAGAGAVLIFQSSPVVRDCSFVGNTVSGGSRRWGGAVLVQQAAPHIVGCSFEGNEAPDAGGAIYVVQASTPIVEDCTFVGNRTEGHGSAIYSDEDSGADVRDSSFCDNEPALASETLWGTTEVSGNVFCPLCPGDINADGVRSFEDLLEVLRNWGRCP